MTNNEFIAELAHRLDISPREAIDMMDGFVAEFAGHLAEEDAVTILGFGTFSVKKKMERVVINPATKQRMLVPPKMVINFKASPTMKDKLRA